MKIGIDARLIAETGVGRYIRNLIEHLSDIDESHEYIIFLRKRDFDVFVAPNSRFQKRLADVPWHSAKEQLFMPWIFMREHLDILHVPYFNAPIFYPGKYVITIHDLTILHFDTGKASTLPYWIYKIRRLGYRIVLSIGMRRASHVITVSETVKKDIIANFGIPENCVQVTYEGVDPKFSLEKKSGVSKLPVEGNFFLYVGNVYPHKNIETLLEAYVQYRHAESQPSKLVFVGPSDYFYTQLETLLPPFGLGSDILILHTVSDHTLARLYAGAVALLFPSRMEGFGLPALEALASGCRVVCSDIPVFHEILGSHAVYVDTTSAIRLARAMRAISRKKHNPEVYKKSVAPQLSKFSWKTLAEKTVAVYQKVGQSR